MNNIKSESTLNLQDAERYAGKWIAVLDSNVIADGKNIEKVYMDALKISNGRIPLFEYVPLTDEIYLLQNNI